MSIENQRHRTQNQELFSACRQSNSLEVQRLLAAGAAPNARTPDNETPLHMAALKGHAELANILIQAGANVNLQDLNGRTPLYLAAAEEHICYGATVEGRAAVANVLIQAGADVNMRDINDKTPIHKAATNNWPTLVEILINAGANVNMQDIGGQTPLFFPAIFGYTAVAEILINAGADGNLTDINGSAPILLAARSNHVGLVVQMLNAYVRVQCNGQLDTYAKELCNHYAPEIVKVARGDRQVVNQTMIEFETEIRAYRDIVQFTQVALHEPFVAPAEDEEEEDDTEEFEISPDTVFVTESQATWTGAATSDETSAIAVADELTALDFTGEVANADEIVE